MRASDIILLTFAIVGFTSLIGDLSEPDPELWNAIITVSRICLVLLFIDYLPRVIKKLGSNGLTDVLLIGAPCVGCLMAVYALVPDADPNLLEGIAIVCVFVSMMIVKLARRHFIKKHGYRVASSDNAIIPQDNSEN